jgi:dihydrofolate reductase
MFSSAQCESLIAKEMTVGKISVMEYLTLDGVIEAPEKWQFPYLSDDLVEFNQVAFMGYDAILLGRVTYEIFVGFWPTQTNNEFGLADRLNSLPKFVVSSTLDKAEWNNSTLVREDILGELTRLKQQFTGKIALIGSANLAQSLMEAELVDEYQLQVYPIILGNGQRLFNGPLNTTALQLIETKTFNSGVVHLSYQRE